MAVVGDMYTSEAVQAAVKRAAEEVFRCALILLCVFERDCLSVCGCVGVSPFLALCV